MQPEVDSPVDYANLLPKHQCLDCKQGHRLAALPAVEGWDVAVRCGCARNGHVRRYSTESAGHPTIDAAEKEVHRLLSQQPTEGYTNLKNITPNNGFYRVRFYRNGKNINAGNFASLEDAIKVRDAFLERDAA